MSEEEKKEGAAQDERTPAQTNENQLQTQGEDESAKDDGKKTVESSKLPKIFRKEYSEKALSKILKKIYIEADRKLVESIFTEERTVKNRKLLSIDQKRQIEKKDFNQLKEIAKAIKSNKGRMKFIPLLAVASFIAAIALVVAVFKNPIAKKIIKSGCEAAFGAKTDIQSVKVKLLGISIRVNGIAIGDKNSEEYDYMKNLFEAEKITIDMNFTQALRGKAIINDVSVEGMKFGTDRTTSCYIPPKERTSLKNSAFAKELKARSDKALEDLKAQAAEIAGGSSVDEIVSNIESQLKTPAAAKKAREDVQTLVAKWQAKPDELKTQVETFSESVKELQKLDMKSFKSASDVEKVKKAKEYLETVNAAIKQGDELKSAFEKTTSEVKADVESTEKMAADMAAAVNSDKDLAVGLVNKVTDTVKNSKQILGTALDTVGYDMMGKYYPYVEQGVAYAVQMKANSSSSGKDSEKESKKEEKSDKKKGSTGRLKGRTIWHSRQYPGLWIKNVSASGYTENDGSKGFSGAIKDITSDQNITGLPTTAEAKFDVGSIKHAGKITLDVRDSSRADLIAMDYTGTGFSAKIDGAKIASASGIPSIEGKALVTVAASAGSDGFSANGRVDLNPVTLSSDGFANETVTKYYKTALASITDMSVGYEMAYRNNSGISLGLSGNFMDKFQNAFMAAFNEAVGDAKEMAIAKINEKINGEYGEVTEKIKGFLGIEGEIDVQNTNLDTVRKSLEAKKAELENMVQGKVDEAKAQAEAKKQEAEDKAKQKAAEETNKAAEKATSAIKDKASNLFKKK